MWGNPTMYHFDNDDLHSDINECEEGTHECDVNTKCSNTEGSYRCTDNVGSIEEVICTGLNTFLQYSALVCGVIIKLCSL